MDLPCPRWIKHVEQIWSGLDPGEKNKFSAQTDMTLDQMFDFGLSHITTEDVSILSSIGETYSVRKCAQRAAKLREQGNGRFKVKDYTSAALYYSQGLCQAPADLEHLALCYANRSAALLHLAHYQECLEDISRALAHGYPSQLQPKLLTRRDQCQTFIQALPFGQETGTATPTIPQKPKDHNSTPAGTADHPHTCSTTAGVSLGFSSEKGRHLVVVEGKCAGEVLLEDQAFSCVLIPGEGTMGGQEGSAKRGPEGAQGPFGTEDRCCHHCLCPTLCPLPCPGCSYSRYCGRECQEQAWQEHHRWECPLGAELRAAGILAQLALRVALKGGLQQVRRAQRSEVTDMGQPKEEVSEGMKKKASDDGKENTCGHSTTAPPSGQAEPVLQSSASVQMTDFCVGCNGDAYQRVYSLLPHVEGHAPSLRFLYAVTIATLYQLLKQTGPPPSSWGREDCVSDRSGGQSACEDAVCGAWTPELSILGATALRHLLQLRGNAQAITAERVSDETGTAVQASREIRIATAIFPTLSLMNHACRPNTSVTFDPGAVRCSPDTSVRGVSVTVRASRDLNTGEEILHCYGPHCSRMAVQQRQRLLLEQYLFTCQCEACLQDLQLPPVGTSISTHYKCPKCAKPLQTGPGVYVCVCKGCSGQVSSRDVKQTLEFLTVMLDQALELLDQESPVEALRLLQEALKRAKLHLLDTHQLLGQLSDATARAYASTGDWGSAASHLSRSVVSVRCQFGADSVEVGQQLFKLAQLHFNGGQAGQCVSVMAEASRVLSLHRHAHSQELQELRAMEDCLKGAL